MVRKRKVSQEELESVLSGIVHEIRNPLNALNINNLLLAEYADLLPEWFAKKDEMKEIIDANTRVLSRLNDLVSEFLRLTRPPRPEFVVSDLNKVVEEVVRFVDVDFRARDIRVKYVPGRGPYPVLVDEKMIKQALLNILLNAAESLDKKKRNIRVVTGSEERGFFVSIIDNGCGIGRNDRKKIFSVFYTTKSGGSGLGLPIVKKIMREHHGKIRIRSRKEKGTEVSLVFPPESKFKAVIAAKNRGKYLPEVVR